jgi:hypothetical protein
VAKEKNLQVDIDTPLEAALERLVGQAEKQLAGGGNGPESVRVTK